MEKKTFSIPTITCGHCVMTIRNELLEMDGVSKVEGDPDRKEIVVEWAEPAREDSIRSTLTEINYPAAG
ncbi:heavy-metal-associated domain-containing protein [Thermodesulfobacteriota bacterium]